MICRKINLVYVPCVWMYQSFFLHTYTFTGMGSTNLHKRQKIENKYTKNGITFLFAFWYKQITISSTSTVKHVRLIKNDCWICLTPKYDMWSRTHRL